jgi:NAD(P)-dependent dehydrogenase (short-subunit alcohol dehydrogenase family)
MAGKLSGKVAIVTGASRGIPRVRRIALAYDGTTLIPAARSIYDMISQVRLGIKSR